VGFAADLILQRAREKYRLAGVIGFLDGPENGEIPLSA